MQLENLLYYRYLYRQTILMLIISFILSLTICLVFIFTNILDIKEIQYTISGLIWIFFIYVLIIFFIWFIKYKQIKNKYEKKELFLMFKNSTIREKILKSGIRIKYLYPNKNQLNDFVKAIEGEINKQKQLFAIKNKK